MIQGLGNRMFKDLIHAFGSVDAVFKARVSELAKIKGMGETMARRISNKQFNTDPEKEMKKAEKYNINLITYQDAAYPPLLKEIHSPPMLLYVKGQDIPLNRTLVAMVGSRNATHYGIRVSEEIGFGLARRGIGVVSGMAKGIDSAAHWGCLKGKGFTVAVIGTGIDRVYPNCNRALSEQISEKGVVVSEFPMGSPPEPKNFPIRNRIISGLSRGVIVVEATTNSGSLITASMALEQGREVFAVPGSIHSFKSTGTHMLIKQGARLVENADDILEELGLADRPVQKDYFFPGMDAVMPELGVTEKKVYETLNDYPIHIDDLVRRLEMDAGEVSGILMGLELKGLARQLVGKQFVR